MPTELPLEFIEKLPKTDLHCHLDGSLRLDTILDLAKQQGVSLPTFDKGGAADAGSGCDCRCSGCTPRAAGR